jgi:hypothetical protein
VNFSKNKTLFPVWGKSGRPILSVVMIYQCVLSVLQRSSNMGKRWTLNASWHNCPLTLQISTLFIPLSMQLGHSIFTATSRRSKMDNNLMITTYANGTKLSNMMFGRLGISYKTKVATYLSQQPTENIATFEEFIKGSYPPSGRTLRG